ncbi:MAG: DEAD/DEAH box helicase [Nitrososphaerota archaeon]|nr:DEAD/DEAH box helicase [Candidatus Aenigmarchaeota archaeon]MDW8034440.1 DEAD/DEAH box helicase [Nitrososphaerota archaeon]
MNFLSSIEENGWQVVYKHYLPSRSREVFEIDDLRLSEFSKRYLKNSFPDGIYRHQKEALERFLNGKNICITSGTASGKSLIFYVGAMEKISRSPESKIIAIYPLKALGKEQEERWTQALKSAELNSVVGRIDGQVEINKRLLILGTSRVVIFTPDIIHAWLLSNLSQKSVINFLKKVSLVIVDEIHTYTGVFGSNSAFLFRRLQHLMRLLNNSPSFICASATIANPENHLKNLFGLDFSVISEEYNTSPKHECEIYLVNPPRTSDFLKEISIFLNNLSAQDKTRFITFVDSRKQTEHIASILNRMVEDDDEDEVEDDDEHLIGRDYLEALDILPFRSGYEEHDRNIIQDRLSKGKLKGVISTSALELGIDIPHLNVGVLIGVPNSLTSFYQRIGRIGRTSKGTVFIINTGDVYDEEIFRKPETLFSRPLLEGCLYLQNKRIQYIHCLCLARHGGEHDQVCQHINGNNDIEFHTEIEWPDGFVELCRKERIGEISTDLQNIKYEAGDDPNHVYPLRDVERQFSIEIKQGPEHRSLGNISYGQVMREAYPGAVYYYVTRPFRVYQVLQNSRIIRVRREKRYTTKPQYLPTLIFPNLTKENVFKGMKFGDMSVVECNLQIRESITGFRERRGPNERVVSYPSDPLEASFRFDLQRFTRNYFTTGVIITHPSFNIEGVNCDAIASLIYEVFFTLIPLERRDINFSVDKFRISRGVIKEGNKFIAIYDQTYGSLRLSGCLVDENNLRRIMKKSLEIIKEREDSIFDSKSRNLAVIKQLNDCVSGNFTVLTFEDEVIVEDTDEKIRIIMPGSKGLNINRGNEEFTVRDIFYRPRDGLCYRGFHLSDTQEGEIIVPHRAIIEIPGESRIGFYNLDTGSIESLT